MTSRHRPVRHFRRGRDQAAQPRVNNRDGKRAAVIVNDMSEIDIDADDVTLFEERR